MQPEPWAAGRVACLSAVALVRVVPETARPTSGWRIRRPRVPAKIRGPFIRVALTAAAVWAAAGGLFFSVIPSYSGMLVLHTRNPVLLGLVTGIVLVASCLAQLAVQRGAPPARAQASGLPLLALGLLALVLAAPIRSLALLVSAAVLAGAGHGIAFLSAQDDLTRIAPERQRAEVSAAYYVCIYPGVALPVIGLGVLAVLATPYIAMVTFAVFTGIVTLAAAVWHLAADHATSTS